MADDNRHWFGKLTYRYFRTQFIYVGLPIAITVFVVLVLHQGYPDSFKNDDVDTIRITFMTTFAGALVLVIGVRAYLKLRKHRRRDTR